MQQTTYPQVEQFPIGFMNNPAGDVIGVGRFKGAGPILGQLRNTSAAAFTLEVFQSDDNLTYASVQTETVEPGGVLDFIITVIDDAYVRFDVTPQASCAGVLTLTFNTGRFDRVGGSGVAYNT